MGAKKKGIANKLAKMSDEERARYLQQRADIEEEARRRKEQLIATFMKNKLKKEDGFLRLNLSKINQYWHQILRKVKCKEMKEDLEHMKKWIERTIALKNRAIENLLQELEDAEDQYSNNLQAHLTHIDNMLEFHRDYLNSISASYEEDRDWLLENLETEKEELNARALNEETYLKTIIFGQNSKSAELMKKAHLKYDDDKIEELTTYKLDMETMKKEREDICSALWKQVASVLRAHVENVDKKRSHLAELRRLDAESSAEILKNQARINQEEQTIEKLRKEYQTLKEIKQEELKNLNELNEKLSKDILIIRKQLQKDIALDEKLLRFMTDESNKTITYLETILNKGQQILLLVEACKKYETDKESLIRYLPSINTTEYVNIHKDGLDLNNFLAESTSTDSSSVGQEESSLDVLQETGIRLSSGAVKYKIRRPQTTYTRRFEKRMQKSIKQVMKDAESDEDATMKFYEDKTSRPQMSKQKLMKLQENLENGSVYSDFPLNTFENLKDLDNMWLVFNNLQLNLAGLKQEKKSLLDENKHLRGMMRSILEAAALDKSGVCTKISTRVCSRYKSPKSAPPLQLCNI